MKKTISLARIQSNDLQNRDLPVAAILVDDMGNIVAEALNSREKDQSIIAHAEIKALENAAKLRKSWNLSDCRLYVSLEPCAMCAGAILQAHISKVIFAAYEPKSGAFGSRYNLCNNKLEIIGGILEEEASELMTSFFKKLRDRK